jgi:tetratricopeptide (TPR) repeat protein
MSLYRLMTLRPTISLLEEGLTLHRRGAVAEAATRYDEVLRIEPGNADAHYYLATILCQQNRFADGAEHARRSLANDPHHVRAHVLLGRALNALGHANEAIASFDRGIALTPDFAQAHSHRADILSDLGRNHEAVESYNQALALAPESIEDRFNRGIALAALGRDDEAIIDFAWVIKRRSEHTQAYVHYAKALSAVGDHEPALAAIDQVLVCAPNLPEAWLGRGNVLHALRRHHDALAAYHRALTLTPDLAVAWLGCGNVLCDLNEYDDALAAYDRALAVKPNLAGAWLGRGNILFEREQQNFEIKKHDDAFAAYQRALELSPDLAAAWHGRANVLHELKRPKEALAAYERALELRPRFADAWHGRGNVLYALSFDLDSIGCFDKAISLNKDFAPAYYGKSLAKLMLGQYEEGWRLYEWRWQSRLATAVPRDFDRPLWVDGSELSGQTILIHSEQGFGDTIQFCRYLALVKQLNCRVIFEVPAALFYFLRGAMKGSDVVRRGDSLPSFDVHCPLMSLPLAFRTTLETIPGGTPYLFADDEKAKQWTEFLGIKRKPRIGLAWSGNIHPDPSRSIQLEVLSKILSEKVEWHSLQKDVRDYDRAFLVDCPLIEDHSQQLRDFSDTAALISEMDLVVSIDTAVAHLAGALGKDVWIMLPFHPDFRWLRDRMDCPWYPTATLYRQSEDKSWDGVLTKVSADLARWLRLN